MRIIIMSLAAAFVVSATPAVAAPLLKGTYTVAGSQMCQAPVGRTGGDIEHQMGKIVFTPVPNSPAKANFSMSVKDQWGPSVSSSGSVAATAVTVSGTATVSGSSNPYAITLSMTTPHGKMTTSGFAQLDLAGATDGIARRAVVLSRSSNGDMSGLNCTTEMLLFRQ